MTKQTTKQQISGAMMIYSIPAGALLMLISFAHILTMPSGTEYAMLNDSIQLCTFLPMIAAIALIAVFGIVYMILETE